MLKRSEGNEPRRMFGILDPSMQEPVKYMLTPLFFGVTTGPMYGGVTGVMMNMSGTPDLTARVLRSTAIFCIHVVVFLLHLLGSYDGPLTRSFATPGAAMCTAAC